MVCKIYNNVLPRRPMQYIYSISIFAVLTNITHHDRLSMIYIHIIIIYIVNVGCVPKKVMWSAAHIADILRHDAQQYGFETNNTGGGEIVVKLNFAKLKRSRDEYVSRLNTIYANGLQSAGITVVYGEGTFVDAHTIQVVTMDDTTTITNSVNYTADKIVIATGGRPHFPPGIGISEHCLSSDDFFALEELPPVSVIVGAGYIAVELAGVLNSLGSEVHLVVRKERALREFDPMISTGLDEEMRKAGIHVHRHTNGVAKVVLVDDNGTNNTTTKKAKKNVTLQNGDVIYGADIVLMAAGRVPNTERLCRSSSSGSSTTNTTNADSNNGGNGEDCVDCQWAPNTEKLHLECCGVAVSSKGSKYILVDEYQNTNVPNIFALG